MLTSRSSLSSILLILGQFVVAITAVPFNQCGLTRPSSPTQLDQLPDAELTGGGDKQVLKVMYWGRGSSTWDCGAPQRNVLNMNLYDVTTLPEDYRYEVLSGRRGAAQLDMTNLEDIPIAAFGKTVSQLTQQTFVINSPDGLPIFNGNIGPGPTTPPLDSPRGPKGELALTWDWYLGKGYPEATIYRVNTGGGYHRCKPMGDPAWVPKVVTPFNALFMLYGDPAVKGITQQIPVENDLCQYVSKDLFPAHGRSYASSWGQPRMKKMGS
ncbi:MAG: hypothetical protein M1816_003502 [Peltula sp. TS41687]|nr:MAG: hypothetical protein M1816_003502 [Peltula sp. TS41687]